MTEVLAMVTEIPPPSGAAFNGQILPVSPAQHGLWVVSQLEQDSAAYNIPIGLRLSGPLRTGVLERSLQAIVARHDSLRTTFELSVTQLVQRVSHPIDFTFLMKTVTPCS